MALPFQTTLRWATEADFDALVDVMFAAVREGESPYTEAPRRGSGWRTRLLAQEIIGAGRGRGNFQPRDVIAWMSARIAGLRGIESGYAVVHAGRESVLSASDRYGRFIVESRSAPLPGVAVVARVPLATGAPTPYARFGDWFGWSCLVLAVVMRLWAGKRGDSL